MAQYRVDNRILSEEEYKDERTHLWAAALFVPGALIVGHQAHEVLPHEWSRAFRFFLIILASVIGGGVPALLAGHIRPCFYGRWLAALWSVRAIGSGGLFRQGF